MRTYSGLRSLKFAARLNFPGLCMGISKPHSWHQSHLLSPLMCPPHVLPIHISSISSVVLIFGKLSLHVMLPVIILTPRGEPLPHQLQPLASLTNLQFPGLVFLRAPFQSSLTLSPVLTTDPLILVLHSFPLLLSVVTPTYPLKFHLLFTLLDFVSPSSPKNIVSPSFHLRWTTFYPAIQQIYLKPPFPLMTTFNLVMRASLKFCSQLPGPALTYLSLILKHIIKSLIPLSLILCEIRHINRLLAALSRSQASQPPSFPAKPGSTNTFLPFSPSPQGVLHLSLILGLICLLSKRSYIRYASRRRDRRDSDKGRSMLRTRFTKSFTAPLPNIY